MTLMKSLIGLPFSSCHIAGWQYNGWKITGQADFVVSKYLYIYQLVKTSKKCF